MTERTGGCLCGHVRYRLTADPVSARICWCRDCQHIAGNGLVNALFPKQAIEVTGATREYVRTAESGNRVSRHFCPECGCHLFAESSGYPGVTVVRVGTLDDPTSVKPSANIWTSTAPGWACLDPVLARSDRQPAPVKPPPGAT